MLRPAILLLLALLPTTAWAQEFAPFEPFVEESARIVEAPADSVRALAERLWPDVLITGADPDEAAPWTADIRSHERGAYVRLAHFVSSLENVGTGLLYERLDAFADSLALPPLSAKTRQPSAGGDTCSDDWADGKVLSSWTRPDGSVLVQQPPSFLPNDADGMRALQERLSYPETASEQGIQGRVIVGFIVDEQGVPTCPRVLRGVHPLLDQAALDAIFPARFSSGVSRGRPPTKIRFSLPITFRLR